MGSWGSDTAEQLHQIDAALERSEKVRQWTPAFLTQGMLGVRDRLSEDVERAAGDDVVGDRRGSGGGNRRGADGVSGSRSDRSRLDRVPERVLGGARRREDVASARARARSEGRSGRDSSAMRESGSARANQRITAVTASRPAAIVVTRSRASHGSKAAGRPVRPSGRPS
jgi:hypothetical protein